MWRFVSQRLLHPGLDFATHQAMARAVYMGWPASALGPPPLWVPSREDVAGTNVAQFLATFKVGGMAWCTAPCTTAAAGMYPAPCCAYAWEQEVYMSHWGPCTPGLVLFLMQ